MFFFGGGGGGGGGSNLSRTLTGKVVSCFLMTNVLLSRILTNWYALLSPELTILKGFTQGEFTLLV